MKPEYTFFRKEDVGKLYEAFVKAFSEYYVNFNPSANQFSNRIFHKLNIHSDLSGLVWENKEVIGFILHTANEYQGKATAYNGGTGVVPEKRNRKLMTSLYEKLLPEMISNKIERILLEVVADNHVATRFYESLDFRYKRTLHCFKTYEIYNPKNSCRIENSPAIKAEYENFQDFEPSFLDSSNQLEHNMQKEFILEAFIEEQLAGYIIFQPTLGRISQVAVRKECRGENIARELLAHAQAKSLNKKLTIMNVPDYEQGTIEGLIKLGFKNEVSQYEMELTI